MIKFSNACSYKHCRQYCKRKEINIGQKVYLINSNRLAKVIGKIGYRYYYVETLPPYSIKILYVEKTYIYPINIHGEVLTPYEETCHVHMKKYYEMIIKRIVKKYVLKKKVYHNIPLYKLKYSAWIIENWYSNQVEKYLNKKANKFCVSKLLNIFFK